MTDLPCNCTPCLLGEWSHAEERLPTLAQWQALNARLEKAERAAGRVPLRPLPEG